MRETRSLLFFMRQLSGTTSSAPQASAPQQHSKEESGNHKASAPSPYGQSERSALSSRKAASVGQCTIVFSKGQVAHSRLPKADHCHFWCRHILPFLGLQTRHCNQSIARTLVLQPIEVMSLQQELC